jgi:hypothetical protein
LQDSQLPFEWLSSLGRGDELVRTSPGPEVVSEFVEGTAEAFRRSEAFKAQQGVVALFDSSVVWLDPIVFVAATPMLDLLPEHFGDGARRGVVSVGGHLFRAASGHGLGTAEEALGRGPISFRTQQGVDELPVPIDGTIQVTPPSTHF